MLGAVNNLSSLYGPVATPAIWVYSTDPRFNRGRDGGYAAFLSPEQAARLERIRQAQLLFDGHHRQYFLGENRTQFNFPSSRVSGWFGDREIQMFEMMNLLQLVSKTSADLLFLDDPLLRCADEYQKQAMQDLIDRCDLFPFFHQCAVECSAEAESFLEACVEDGEVYLHSVPAEEIFPVGKPRPDRQYRQYDRFRTAPSGISDKIKLVLKTSYLPGLITNICYQLDEQGNIQAQISLDAWPTDAGEPRPVESVATGISDNTITYVPNEINRGRAVSDYDQSLEIQDAINAKNTQVNRVLAKHADPKMAGPEEMARTPDGNVRQDHDMFYFRDPAQIPKYIVWDAQLKAAMDDRDAKILAMCYVTETSPVLLGIKIGTTSHAQSYKTVRLESFKSISKAARKAKYWRAGIKRALAIAQSLENTIPGIRYNQDPITPQLRDGIPSDDLEEAQVESLQRTDGTLSVYEALMRRYNDPQKVEDEIAELEKENAAKTPTILMAPPQLDTAPGAPPPASIEEQEVTGAQAEEAQVAA